MFSKSISTLFVVLTMTSSLAIADQMGPDGDKFYEEAARFENACAQEPCRAPYSHKVLFDQEDNLNELSEKAKIALNAIAIDQAQVWADTILEGDYYSTGRTRLDQVVAFYKSEVLVGYKIQYSEKAWYTGDCEFDGDQSSLANCQEGRIVEGSYVSPDALTYFSDEERYAEFSSSSL